MDFHGAWHFMSRSHVRISDSPPRQRRWLEVLVIGSALLLILGLALSMFMRAPFDMEHDTATGAVLESKIVVVGLRDTTYGGVVLYQIEVRVRYSHDRKTQDQWMVGSAANSSRQELQAQLNRSPQACEVYWEPSHPENARCRFQ